MKQRINCFVAQAYENMSKDIALNPDYLSFLGQ